MSPDELEGRPNRPPVLSLPDGRKIIARKGTTFTNRRRELDLCFVFDTTGSMSAKIAGLIDCMDFLVEDLGRMALDWRMTTVPFGDLTMADDLIITTQPFVAEVQSASRQLRSMPRLNGGWNVGESSAEAMAAACAKPYRPGAVKVLVLITDEPALNDQQGIGIVDGLLGSLDAVCFTIATDAPYYKSWATQHGGEWRQVAAAVDTSAITALFKSMLARVVTVADSVHRIGGGSVRAYLERGGDERS